MISQEKRLIITFRCTTDAIAMEKSCKATGAPGRLIPVPRSISAGMIFQTGSNAVQINFQHYSRNILKIYCVRVSIT